jgi:transposase
MSLLHECTGRIFAYRRPVDMRKGFRGLESLILQDLGEDPLSGDTFVFINRDGKHMKCFLWDRTGYVIIAKRLERGRFQLRGSTDRMELDNRRLRLFLDGINIGGISTDTLNI